MLSTILDLQSLGLDEQQQRSVTNMRRVMRKSGCSSCTISVKKRELTSPICATTDAVTVRFCTSTIVRVAPRHVDASRDFFFLRMSSVGGGGALPDFIYFSPVQQTC